MTNELNEWLWSADVTDDDREKIQSVVELLQDWGPALKRPTVGEVNSSRHHNMKELIPLSSNIRILFMFDTRSQAILLIGGDKTNDWDGFYKRMVPIADDLYDEYLRQIEEEELLSWPDTQAGTSTHQKFWSGLGLASALMA